MDRLTAEIEKIFEEYPTDPVLFWILLFLREEYYSSPQKRLAALRKWILSGSRSPFFYLEVYDLWCRDPQLLTEPGCVYDRSSLLGSAARCNDERDRSCIYRAFAGEKRLR